MGDVLSISPLFTGLTRPAMVMGITLDYVCFSVVGVLCLFILTNSPLALTLYFPLHLLGWLICKIDPALFAILLKQLVCGVTPHRTIYGCQCYAPF